MLNDSAADCLHLIHDFLRAFGYRGGIILGLDLGPNTTELLLHFIIINPWWLSDPLTSSGESTKWPRNLISEGPQVLEWPRGIAAVLCLESVSQRVNTRKKFVTHPGSGPGVPGTQYLITPLA